MRTQHLVDIENLCGSGLPTVVTARRVIQSYLSLSKWTPGDLTVIACNRKLARGLVYEMPEELSYQFRIGRAGPDGADRELLRAAMAIDAPSRFGRIVVASGDHYFEPLIARCKTVGTRIEIVVGRGALSGRLAAGADRILHLPVGQIVSQPPSKPAATMRPDLQRLAQNGTTTSQPRPLWWQDGNGTVRKPIAPPPRSAR